MPKLLAQLRTHAFQAQHGRCYYCGCPMWINDIASFAHAHGLTIGQARLLRATAEHLTARQDGGRDSAANIAAACSFCNLQRHNRRDALDPDAYARHVAARLAAGRWHGIRVCP